MSEGEAEPDQAVKDEEAPTTDDEAARGEGVRAGLGFQRNPYTISKASYRGGSRLLIQRGVVYKFMCLSLILRLAAR